MSRLKVTVGDESWMFDAERVLNVELMDVERLTGMSADEFQNGINRGSLIAITGLVWLLKKRHVDPTIAFSSVVFNTGDLKLEPEDDAPLGSAAPATTATLSEPTTPPESSSSSGSDSAPGNVTASSEPTT